MMELTNSGGKEMGLEELMRGPLSSSEGKGDGWEPKPRGMEMRVEAGGERLGRRMEMELEEMESRGRIAESNRDRGRQGWR